METKTAFVIPIPVHNPAQAPAPSSHPWPSDNRCPTRRPPAAAANLTPPPPGNNNNNDDSQLSKDRAALEHMFRQTLTTTGNRTGQCACIWCHGSKVRKCSWCGGKGYREEIANKSWEELAKDIERMQEKGGIEEPTRVPVQCAACGGSKTLRCIYCRGSGIGSYGHAY